MNFHTDTDVRECDDVREELQPYLLTQYADSVTITQLLADFRDNIDAQNDTDLIEKQFMDIDTAQGIGLDILGRIIGIPRIVQYASQAITLNDETYRRLLKYKAYANISDASLATLNKMLYTLFDEDLFTAENIVVKEQNGGEYYNSFPMHVRFTAKRELNDEEKILFNVGAILNLSAGVGWSLIVIQDNIFGFKNSELQPFNCGTFTSNSNVVEGGA